MAESPYRDPDTKTVVEPATAARQGEPVGRVRWVLAIGLVCVIIAFAIIYMTFVSVA